MITASYYLIAVYTSMFANLKKTFLVPFYIHSNAHTHTHTDMRYTYTQFTSIHSVFKTGKTSYGSF